MAKRRRSSGETGANSADEGRQTTRPRKTTQSASGQGARDSHNVRSPQLRALAGGTELWSMAEMMEAEPVPMPELDEAAETQLDAEASVEGEGGSDPGGMPALESQADTLQPQVSTGGYDYPGPYSRYDVFPHSYEHYPYACVGKIFFRHGSRNYVGSAFSVGNNAVFTAGHCVHPGNGDDDDWFTNFVFVPAFSVDEHGDPVTPFGQWPASFLMARQRWIDNGNPGGFTEDMGGAVLQKVGGRSISQHVGYLGFAWNWRRQQHWHAIGYPAGAPFTGQVMVSTQASYAYDGQVPGIKPMAIGCDMTGGCSGGPWIRKFGTLNQTNGLNSYRRRTHPEEMLSPYFDNRAKSLKDELVAAEP